MNKVFIFVLAGILSIFTLTNANAFEKGDFDLTLSGVGQNDKHFENGAFSLQVAPGYFLTNEVEVGVRQSVSVANSDGSDWAGSTGGFVDYYFNLDKLRPFVGLSVGYNYGDVIDETWTGGPEVGVKYLVNDTTYIYGVTSYQFDLEDGADEGSFTYGVGIGFTF